MAKLSGEINVGKCRCVGREVLEADVVESQIFDMGNGLGVFRLHVLGRIENMLEVAQRNLGFAINADYVAQLLQRAEDGERVDEERKELAQADVVLHPQIEQQHDDDVAQQVHERALHEAQRAQVAHLAQLQL